MTRNIINNYHRHYVLCSETYNDAKLVGILILIVAISLDYSEMLQQKNLFWNRPIMLIKKKEKAIRSG